MIIKRLTLKNFRQFKDEQELFFLDKNNCNVTTILGKNTSGKTTLIQAFLWCLYGLTNFDTKDFMLNLEVAEQLHPGEESEVKAEIELIHDNITYIVNKTQKYQCTSNLKVKPLHAATIIQYKNIDGQTEFIKNNEVTNMINKILPQDLSSYFFFDGERIGNLGNNYNGKKDIANAVQSILGLNVISNAIKHISSGKKYSVIKKFENSMSTENDQALNRLKKEKDKIENDIEDEKRELYDCEKLLEHYKNEKEELEEFIMNHKATEELQRDIKKHEHELKQLEDKKNSLQNKFLNDFSSKSFILFMKPLINNAMNILQDVDVKDKGIPNMNSESIDFIINRGVCICGCEINEESELYKNLLNQKEYLPPKSIGTLVNSFINNADYFLNISDEVYNSLIEKYKDLMECMQNISELKSIIEEKSNKISLNVDVAKKQEELNKTKENIKTQERQRDELNKSISKLEFKKEEKDKEIDNMSFVSSENDHIRRCIRYAKYINEQLNNYYEEKESIIREKLEEKINEIFSKMYHGERTIKLDEKYNHELVAPKLSNEFQYMADESTGLDTVKSFAVMGGIVDLAKEKLSNEDGDNDDFEIKSESYPLVMDAPFSNADEEHVKNVAQIMPEVAEQVIMFLMYKDWQHVKDVLEPKLNKMYKLNKKSETCTFIEEVKNV